MYPCPTVSSAAQSVNDAPVNTLSIVACNTPHRMTNFAYPSCFVLTQNAYQAKLQSVSREWRLNSHKSERDDGQNDQQRWARHMARGKRRITNDESGSGAPSAPGLASGTQRGAAGLEPAVALGLGLPAVVQSAPAGRSIRVKSLTVGTSDGSVTGALTVGLKINDYAAKKRAAERANSKARRIEAGTYVSSVEAVERTLAKAREMWAKPYIEPERSRCMRMAQSLRTELLVWMTQASKFDEDRDHEALRELSAALGTLQSALKARPRHAS